MKLIWQSQAAQILILLFLWIVSMVFSAEFFLSLSMIGLLLVAFIKIREEEKKVQWLWRPGLKAEWRAFIFSPTFSLVMVPFFLVLLSSVYTSDWTYNWERLQIKLPFLVLPFAFFRFPRLSQKYLIACIYFLLAVMTISGLYVMLLYWTDMDMYHQQLAQGKAMPTPSNHIRYSLTLALSIMAGLIVLYENIFLKYSWERYILGFVLLILTIFLHVLSVRSGILGLYAGISGMVIFAAIRYKKWSMLFGLAGLIVVVPLAAYYSLPSLQQKISYSIADYNAYKQNGGAWYSDGERWVSIQAGWELFKSAPILGVGAGDVRSMTEAWYAEQKPDFPSYKMPHSQWVTFLAGTGIIGTALFAFAFFFPMFKRFYASGTGWIWGLHSLMFVSFFTENTLENNFGISMYLLFLLPILCWKR